MSHHWLGTTCCFAVEWVTPGNKYARYWESTIIISSPWLLCLSWIQRGTCSSWDWFPWTDSYLPFLRTSQHPFFHNLLVYFPLLQSSFSQELHNTKYHYLWTGQGWGSRPQSTRCEQRCEMECWGHFQCGSRVIIIFRHKKQALSFADSEHQLGECSQSWSASLFHVPFITPLLHLNRELQNSCTLSLHIPHVHHLQVIVFEKQRDTRDSSKKRGGISRFRGWWC